jgi:PAS domain S-box-containing protein
MKTLNAMFLQRFLLVWKAMVRPLDNIANPKDRDIAGRVARAVAWLGGVSIGLLIFGDIFFTVSPLVKLIIGVFLLGCLLIFLINRTRFYHIAPLAFLLLYNITLYLVYFTSDSILPHNVFPYLMIVMFLSTRFVSFRITIALLVVNLIALNLTAISKPAPYSFVPLIMYFIITTLAIVAINVGRSRYEKRLEDSETRYRNLMEANHEPIAIVGRNGKILDVNPAFERLSGYKLTELVGKGIMSFATSISFGELMSYNQKEIAAPLRVSVQTAIGKVIPVEVRSRQYRYNDRAAFVVMVHDLSYETEIERQKHEYELRYKALYENTNDGVFIINLDGKHISANDTALSMLDFTKQEFAQKSLQDTVVKEEVDDAFNVIKRLIKGEKVPVYQRKFQGKSRVVVGEVSAMLVRDLDGTPRYVQTTVRNITERDREEKHRLELAIQQERNIVLKQLIDDFSHYVRTPLANVKNSRYLLQRYQGQLNKQNHQLEVIDVEIERMVTLLDDLLLLTRIEPENDTQTIQAIDVHDLVKDILPSPLGNAIVDPYHHWDYQPAAQSPMIHGVYSRLLEALTRITYNARMYTATGGNISVAVQTYPHHRVVCIAIRDNGMGIDPSELPYIFDNFYRTDTARSINPNSSGLGLAICKKIVEIHRGMVRAKSELGIGSTFEVWLPMTMNTTVDDSVLNDIRYAQMMGD